MLGENHPEYATSLRHLAQAHDRNGHPERAEPLLREALLISQRNLQLTAVVQSEGQQSGDGRAASL